MVLRIIVLPLVLACGSDTIKPEPIQDDDKLFWDLELSHHAVTLSSTASGYDTLRIVATPRNYRGEPLPGLPSPQYTSTDAERVAVTPEGLLVALAPTSALVVVRATLTTDNLKRQDSVFVKVVAAAAPPVLASLSVHPLPPDSAKRGMGIGPILPIRATDIDGGALAGLPVHFRSSDSTIAAVELPFGRVLGRKPGTVTIYASTTAFGITKADTLPYRIAWPVAASILLGDPAAGAMPGSFPLNTWKVGTGAVVSWSSRNLDDWLFAMSTLTLEKVDVTFADADLPNVAAIDLVNPIHHFAIGFFCSTYHDCGSGNFVLGGGTSSGPWAGGPPLFVRALRRFPVPGTYEFRSTIYGTHGRIVVVDER